MNINKEEVVVLAKLMRRNLLLSINKEEVVVSARSIRRKRLLFAHSMKYEVLHPSFPLLS